MIPGKMVATRSFFYPLTFHSLSVGNPLCSSVLLLIPWVTVVTGANKGIGLEICRQLATRGVMVVLTARDEKKGLEALQTVRASGLSHGVAFHRLDVVDPSSVSSLADFIQTQFGKLDILVNNAGVSGVTMDANVIHSGPTDRAELIKWNEATTESYDTAKECLQTNYYGAKRMFEAVLPLLRWSDSPRVVNVSSSAGKLMLLGNTWAQGIFSDIENLTEERIEEVLGKFIDDFKKGRLESEGWPPFMSSYRVSKAALNAYTRVTGQKYPNLLVNSVCPGFVKTDINCHSGNLTPEEGAEAVVRLALLPKGSPSCLFYVRSELSPI